LTKHDLIISHNAVST